MHHRLATGRTGLGRERVRSWGMRKSWGCAGGRVHANMLLAPGWAPAGGGLGPPSHPCWQVVPAGGIGSSSCTFSSVKGGSRPCQLRPHGTQGVQQEPEGHGSEDSVFLDATCPWGTSTPSPTPTWVAQGEKGRGGQRDRTTAQERLGTATPVSRWEAGHCATMLLVTEVGGWGWGRLHTFSSHSWASSLSGSAQSSGLGHSRA